ncbi:GNAT family N-acetyltransferase [Streptomyces candidus]|uniref:Ribosomal protein S18 acetylase RimI-like enzyme n=1 Tax=Streptomyces candidus TaxID=67283 RepID=A0A7X0HEV1_9ACTN|nr:GNAT family N-acetyltransferase [Streptomyces candidus]MBB6436340.1 ribosomal protein S18 acetylase RimI-like enzyme [Streptomyces candidus]GHH48561.1 N-acetyltransferase [Streptomyces candidus]
MTTTLRPTAPLRTSADGARSRTYEVCVNSRPVGTAEIETVSDFGNRAGRIRSLRIDEADRRRGRGTVAALAAEEVLRGWGCDHVTVSVPADAGPALRMVTALGYVERSRNMAKDLPTEPPALPAHVSARPMTQREYEAWRRHSAETYAQSWIDQGVTPEQARAKAEASHRTFLPEGLATPHTWINHLVHDGAPVGFLWVGRHEVEPGVPVAFVYDVEVAEEQRGRGYGRALMTFAERVALRAGESRIALHVFTGNTPALRLYESLGYRTTHLNSYKQLL